MANLIVGNDGTVILYLHLQVSNWINEKLQIALDESYRDPTNLQAKIQKHVAFDAEVSANRNRVDSVKEVITQLILQECVNASMYMENKAF